MTLCLAQCRPRDQVLMHAYRAVHLAPAAKQMTQREMGLERLVIDLRHLHEELEGLVRLTVQNEVQPADVVGADARGRLIVPVPAQAVVRPSEGRKKDQQPGEYEGGFSRHLAGRGCEGSAPRPPRYAAPFGAADDRPTA